MEIKTRFNIGDCVYTVKDTSISKETVARIEVTIYEHLEPSIDYTFRIGFSGSYARSEEEVFATPEEALEYLSKNVQDNSI